MKRFIYSVMMLFIVCIYGCISFEEISGLKTLQGLSSSQKQNEQIVKAQEKRFQKLLNDFNNNSLKKGLTQRGIIGAYGQPISSREISDGPVIKEQFVYRHPMEFFGSEKIYLFFDVDKKLADWRYEEAEVKE